MCPYPEPKPNCASYLESCIFWFINQPMLTNIYAKKTQAFFEGYGFGINFLNFYLLILNGGLNGDFNLLIIELERIAKAKKYTEVE